MEPEQHVRGGAPRGVVLSGGAKGSRPQPGLWMLNSPVPGARGTCWGRSLCVSGLVRAPL